MKIDAVIIEALQNSLLLVSQFRIIKATILFNLLPSFLSKPPILCEIPVANFIPFKWFFITFQNVWAPWVGNITIYENFIIDNMLYSGRVLDHWLRIDD